ncbi:MAG: hypothetical protein Q4D62_15785 [Planctomycetia bacterium]|nr:hypothetical protein [Planctomycetia bacterium]
MIPCPVCGCAMSNVVKTRHYSTYAYGKTHYTTRRTRRCRHCGKLFKTMEVQESDVEPREER